MALLRSERGSVRDFDSRRRSRREVAKRRAGGAGHLSREPAHQERSTARPAVTTRENRRGTIADYISSVPDFWPSNPLRRPITLLWI
jgi:hypothetical protein